MGTDGWVLQYVPMADDARDGSQGSGMSGGQMMPGWGPRWQGMPGDAVDAGWDSGDAGGAAGGGTMSIAPVLTF